MPRTWIDFNLMCNTHSREAWSVDLIHLEFHDDKASGPGGIWERWTSYSRTGHGDNRELVALLKREGADYARHFQFAILEVADINTGELEIDKRESHWKLVLATREHGYNAN